MNNYLEKNKIEEMNIKLSKDESILTLSKTEKIKHLDELRIYYPQMEKVLNKIRECHESLELFEKPLCMRISGPSGSGKTTIVSIYKNKYPEKETPNGIEKPTLYSRIPCPAYIGNLPVKLLCDLGDPFYTKSGKIVLQTQRLIKLLKVCKVQIIFLDEIQHLVDRNSQKLLRDSSDWFKELIEETGIPIVFIGMPDSERIFTENEQLKNRVRLSEQLKPFEYDND